MSKVTRLSVVSIKFNFAGVFVQNKNLLYSITYTYAIPFLHILWSIPYNQNIGSLVNRVTIAK